jgi:hypothetical protein
VKAFKQRSPAHARVYARWLELPTWRSLSPAARCLLVEMLGRFRPGENGRLAWPVRRAAVILGVSKSTAARCLLELERNGFLVVVTATGFGGTAKPSTYRLTMFTCDATHEPASHAFEDMPGERLATDRKQTRRRQSHQRDKTVPLKGLNSFAGGTEQSRQKDKAAPMAEPEPLAAILGKSPILARFKGKANA